MKYSLLPAVIAAVFIAAAAIPSSAHHSFAAFDVASQKTVTGTVKQLDWTNPHIWLWIDVPNDKGGSDTFAFEGMSPNFLARRGWTKNTLKAGDKITITYRPMKDGANGGMFMNGKMPDGRLLTSAGANEPDPTQK